MHTPSKAAITARVGAGADRASQIDVTAFFGIDMGEEMARVYQRLRGEAPGDSPAIVQVIASTPGEGTTSVARELARVAAMRFARCVRLLEVTRAPTMRAGHKKRHTTVGLAPRQIGGLSLFYEQVKGADVVARGRTSDLRLGHQLQQYLRSGYDVVVVDSPSVGASAAGLAMARHVDGIILVVAGDTARLPVVKAARDAIAAHGGQVLGIVFNRGRSHIPRAVHGRS